MTDRVTDRVRVVVHHARFAATLARSIEAKLADRVLVDVNVDEARDPPALADADVLVGFRFPRGLGARMPKLRFVQLTGMGRDVVATLELDAHVRVDDIGDVHARAVAEHAMLALLLARSRGTAIGNVVVLGAGRVGSAIATRARAFGWHTIGLARTTRERDGFAAVTTSLHALRQADAVVIALPLTPETRGLVDAEALAMLPRHAALVDISRGGVVVEAALVDALETGALQFALVDVTDPEPLPQSSPLWPAPHCVVTPHCAWMTDRHAQDVAAVVAQNVARFVDEMRERDPSA